MNVYRNNFCLFTQPFIVLSLVPSNLVICIKELFGHHKIVPYPWSKLGNWSRALVIWICGCSLFYVEESFGHQNPRVSIVLKALKSEGSKGDVPKIYGFVHPQHLCLLISCTFIGFLRHWYALHLKIWRWKYKSNIFLFELLLFILYHIDEFKGNNTVASGWGVRIKLTVGFVIPWEFSIWKE